MNAAVSHSFMSPIQHALSALACLTVITANQKYLNRPGI